MSTNSMARAMVEFAGYVAEQPSMDQVAQQLVLGTLGRFEPRASLLYVFRPEGVVALAGSFGLPAHLAGVRTHSSIWDHTPAVDAIRHDEPVHITSSEALRATYPHLSEDAIVQSALSVWPLKLGSARIGAVQLHFENAQASDEYITELRGISTILSLYLGLRHEEAPPVKVPKSVPVGHGATELTDRQLQVLRFLVAGMTNPQIAQRIGFSDSTVRQETMAIYRFLDVMNRREAAQVAVQRHLVERHPETVG